MKFQASLYPEGALSTAVVNRYERDRNAREAALEKHGSICFGCDVDLKQVYGSDLRDIIEVHRLYPLNLQVEDRKPIRLRTLFLSVQIAMRQSIV
jgi:predicted HNH restriction endonuclease